MVRQKDIQRYKRRTRLVVKHRTGGFKYIENFSIKRKSTPEWKYGSDGKCIQQDDMQEIYPVLDEAEMIVLASPVYYHGFTGQLQCAVNRIYALDKPKHLKKAALILSSGSDNVYDGAVYAYQNSFLDYLKLENRGIFTAFDKQNKSEEKLEELMQFGKSL